MASFAFHQHSDELHDVDTSSTRYVNCVGVDDGLLFPMSSIGRSLLGFDHDTATASTSTGCVERSSSRLSANAAAFADPEYCHIEYASAVDVNDGLSMPPLTVQRSGVNDGLRVSAGGTSRPLPSSQTDTAASIDDRCVYTKSLNDDRETNEDIEDRCRQRRHQLSPWTTNTSTYAGQQHGSVTGASTSSSEAMSGIGALTSHSSQSLSLSAFNATSSSTSSPSSVPANVAHADASRSTRRETLGEQELSGTTTSVGSRISTAYDHQEVRNSLYETSISRPMVSLQQYSARTSRNKRIKQ